MSRRYDLQNVYDLDLLNQEYDLITEGEWEECIEYLSHGENWMFLTKKERDILYTMKRSAGNHTRHSPKQIVIGLSVYDKIMEAIANEQKNEDVMSDLKNDSIQQPARHVTFRVAWHDSAWNGTICKEPNRNNYCSGFNSLLSERIRRRKDESIEIEETNKGKKITESYFPPCFWSVNLFGTNEFDIKHDNPAEQNLEKIREKLPAYSLFSWPFALSFIRGDQRRIDGKYPKNLECVRIPNFRSKMQKKKSIGILYANYSNPLSEDDQEYLVVGCGLLKETGKTHNFKPFSKIEEKRRQSEDMRNFPSINWAMRYTFDPHFQLVRMPYHEYLDYVSDKDIDAAEREKLLDKIKVTISEPELQHCFKYVAMDIDDDETIYILTKIRHTLLLCQNDGIVPLEVMNRKIGDVDTLLEMCWKKRGYFPSFSTISRIMLEWDNNDFALDQFIEELKESEEGNYAEVLIQLLENPNGFTKYKQYARKLRDLIEAYQDSYGLSHEQFLTLCMIGLNPFQAKRILDGKLVLKNEWKKDIESEEKSHKLKDLCDNPYLLFEEYMSYNALLDPVTGEEKDASIDLFKVDVAYFPDVRFGMERSELQRTMRITDERRVRAVLIRYLRTLESTGHCFATAANVEEAVKDYPLFYNIGSEYRIPEDFFESPSDRYSNHYEENERKLKLIHENDTTYYYLNEVYQAEKDIEEVVETLLRDKVIGESYEDLSSYLDRSCSSLKGILKGRFDESAFKEERSKLYCIIYSQKLFVLTGKPGSGKSHELLNIVTDLQNKGQKCLILAPTGKAALRLKTNQAFQNIEASTIDRFFADVDSKAISPATVDSYHNIIIDEMSMVDLFKMRDLLRRFNFKKPSLKRLILVGDPNQLPAIGYGKVFRDIVYYLKTHSEYEHAFISLETNCRQELEESKILEFSEGFVSEGEHSPEIIAKIRSGNPQISSGFRVVFWNSEDELLQKIDEEYELLCNSQEISGDKCSTLNQLFNLNTDGEYQQTQSANMERFQILSPYRASSFGTNRLNDHVVRTYKPDLKYELLYNMFKQSDKIIRTKNYYDEKKLILSNGSIGFIHADSKCKLYFNELAAPMPIFGNGGIRKPEREFFELAYAITVHKAQGSGFNHVFLVLPRKQSLLYKELVYTAVTRSKESITLFIEGEINEPFEKSVLEKARVRSYTESRRTTLLLDKPFRYYSLEVDGYYLDSRVELLIYQVIKEVQHRMPNEILAFKFGVRPVVNGNELPMKTDFSIETSNGTWYWEHLGRLGGREYERQWKEVKIPSYKLNGIYDRLLTTHERNGLNPEKIEQIVALIAYNNVGTEDANQKYSKHHYSLR